MYLSTFADWTILINMQRLLYLYSFILFIVACSNPQEKLKQQIQDLLNSEEISEPDNLQKLAELQLEYGTAYADSFSTRSLYASGIYFYHEKKYDKAKQAFSEFMQRDDSTEHFKRIALYLADIQGQEGMYNQATELIREVLEKHLPDLAQWKSIAQILRQKVDKTEPHAEDYELLASATYATGKPEEAVQCIDTAIQRFPEYEKRANLLFQAGFMSMEYLHDKEKAKSYYNQLIATYPSHELVKDAETILESGMLEMSTEEYLDMIIGSK